MAQKQRKSQNPQNQIYQQRLVKNQQFFSSQKRFKNPQNQMAYQRRIHEQQKSVIPRACQVILNPYSKKRWLSSAFSNALPATSAMLAAIGFPVTRPGKRLQKTMENHHVHYKWPFSVAKTMGNHHFYWVNPRTKKWPCSIANCNKLPEVMYDDPRFKALTPLGTSLFFLSRRLPGTPLLLTVTSDWNHVSMWIFHIHTYIHIYIYMVPKKTYIYIYPYHREYADISH